MHVAHPAVVAVKPFVTFFVVQAVAYLVLVTNLRAISGLQYEFAMGTEMLYLFMQWHILRRVVGATRKREQAGYILGGAAGTLLSMWLTRSWG